MVRSSCILLHLSYGVHLQEKIAKRQGKDDDSDSDSSTDSKEGNDRDEYVLSFRRSSGRPFGKVCPPSSLFIHPHHRNLHPNYRTRYHDPSHLSISSHSCWWTRLFVKSFSCPGCLIFDPTPSQHRPPMTFHLADHALSSKPPLRTSPPFSRPLLRHYPRLMLVIHLALLVPVYQ